VVDGPAVGAGAVGAGAAGIGALPDGVRPKVCGSGAGGVMRFVVVAGFGAGVGAPPPVRAAGWAAVRGGWLAEGWLAGGWLAGGCLTIGDEVRGGLATGGAAMAAVAPVGAGAGPVGAAAAPVTGRWYAVFGSASFLPRPRRSRQDCLGPRGGGGSQTGTPLSGRARDSGFGEPLVRGVPAAGAAFGARPGVLAVRPFGAGGAVGAPAGGRPAPPGWVAAGWVVVPACVAPGRRPLGAQLVTGAGRWPFGCCAGRGFAGGAVRGAPCAGVRAWPPLGEFRTGLAEGWVRGAAELLPAP
jgi:hypothetical protein